MDCETKICVCFLYGAPRSGTTWLQNMLGSHPLVATPQESDLFSRYVAPLHAAWREDTPEPEQWHHRRYKGLPAILTETEFRAGVADFIRRTYESVLAAKPGAEVVLDKVPDYARVAPLAREYFPEAAFINLIRDGRDVALSMLRASRGWGADWAPGSLERAAASWRKNVINGRRMAHLCDRYLELRFEDLRGPAGPSMLQAAFRMCGIELGLAECKEIHEKFSLTEQSAPSSIVWSGEVMRQLGRRPSEPEGFFGEGTADGWRSEFGAYERWVFDQVAGELLVDLGYPAERSGRRNWQAPIRFRLEHGLEELRMRASKLRGSRKAD